MPNPSYNITLAALHQLRHQSVRDLAWCCVSAPLMQALPAFDENLSAHIDSHNDSIRTTHTEKIVTINTGTKTQTQMFPHVNNCDDADLWQWLHALDADPRLLDEQLATRKTTRLGIYYETLWYFYFNHYPQWQLLDYNLQIENAGSTLGAPDFLCRYQGQYFHIETAVKFYLCVANQQQDALAWESWVGPSHNDRLDIKLTRLIQHQLPLHQFPAAAYLLHQRYPAAMQWRSGLCLQGYLFSPAGKHFSPQASHAKHGRGSWWYMSNFLDYLRQQEQNFGLRHQWLILPRRQWLSPAHIPATDPQADALLPARDFSHWVKNQLRDINKPLLVAALVKKDGAEGEFFWQELMRGFVVPDDWSNEVT